MDIWTIILEMIITFSVAFGLGALLERFKLSAIMGYMLAGLILGPGGIGVVHSGIVQTFSGLGVVLLMFSIGLGFSVRHVRALGRTGAVGGVLQIIVTMAVVVGVCLAQGMEWRPAVVIGAMIPMTSTTCVMPVFIQRGELDTVHGRHTIAISVMQDVSVVILAMVIVGIGGEGGVGALLLNTGRLIVYAVAFIVAMVVVCFYILPFALDAASMTKNRELPILLAIIICLASAWSADWLGLSPALGAFVAGMLIAESPFAIQVRADVAGLKTIFVTMFFTSIGMMSSLAWFGQYWMTLLWLLPAVIVFKAVVVWVILRRLGLSHFNAMATGLALSNVGEFAFILAIVGQDMGILTPPLFEPLLLVTFTTMALAPFTVHGAPLAGRLIERLMSGSSRSRLSGDDTDAPVLAALSGHVVVVGLGPSGLSVVQTLRSSGLPAAVIDLNPRNVAEARRLGLAGIVGDATSPDVLEQIHLTSARALMITLPDHNASLQVLRHARLLAPQIPVIVRARYHLLAGEFAKHGAHAVLDEEVEIGRGLAAAVLQLADPDDPQAGVRIAMD